MDINILIKVISHSSDERVQGRYTEHTIEEEAYVS